MIDFKKKPVDRKILLDMTRALAHRGPDDEGIFIDQNIGLGHRRLSIIDLSLSGHQPMFYDNKNLAIVYNGEIYNYLEIRDELQKKGYQFKSQTDTEVILASYQEWGPNCLNKFNGMWALAIYDRKKKLIFCARDRLGVKPFYYFFDKNKFIFASEIKAILKHPEISAKQNDHIIWDYLVCGLVDHSEETFFQGIKELRGGHYLELKIENCKLKINQYWDLDPKKRTDQKNDQYYIEQFKELFLDSVRLRLRSDVPIGTCLSGGLDSSAIVSAVNEFLKQDGKIDQIGQWQKTFSSVFDKKKYSGCDEREFINEMIKKTKVKSHLVFPDDKKLIQEIDKVIYHQDYPFGSTSIYAQWNVFRLAKQNKVKVMLDGQGSDELLAGYHPFFGIYFFKLLRNFQFFRFFSEIVSYSKKHQKPILTVFSELFLDSIKRGILGPTLSKRLKDKWQEYDLFLPNFRHKYKPFKLDVKTNDIFKRGLHNSLEIGLASLLRYEDRDSMAFSLESRVPFLDYRLVEFIYYLPDNQKIRNGETKWVLRQALKGILPEKVRKRQDKIGFATPEEIWMKEALGKDMQKVFSSEKFESRGYFQKGKTTEMFNKYLQGQIKDYHLFWRLYNLEKWFRIFIDTSTGSVSTLSEVERVD